MIKSIVLLENAGAKVHAVVTDEASRNIAFWKENGACGCQEELVNSFQHPLDEKRRI